MAPPATAPTIERIAEDLARGRADMSAPIRDEGAVGTPPLSSVAEEDNRALSPARVEEEPVEDAAPEGAPDLGKGPMMPSTMAVRQNLLSVWAHRHLSLSQGPLTVMPGILPL